MGGPCVVDGVTRPELDNFHQCRVEVDGVNWPSSEHCYQGSKFPDNEEVREKIRTATSGMASWQAGNQTRGIREDWEEVKVDKMYAANFAKFTQNKHLGDLLTDTKGPIAAQGGLYWKTWNEILLERIREELRPPSAQNAFVLKTRKDMMAALREAAAAKDPRRVEAVTTYASKRQLPLSAAELASKKVTLSCQSAKLDWLEDTTFQVDMLKPEVNGEPHYMNTDGMHLYLGMKHSRKAWCVDEVLSPDETCGMAFIEVDGDSLKLPQGEGAWQCFNGSMHEPKMLLVST